MSGEDEQERLVRALRAPGSDAELSGEERYRAMFRAAHSQAAPVATSHSRMPRRLWVGGTVATVVAVGTAGVAAAYSGNLPSPIQTLAHHVIGAPPTASPPSSSKALPPAPSKAPPVPRHTLPSSPSRPTVEPSRPPSARPTPPPAKQPRRPVPSPRASASPTRPAPVGPTSSPTRAASPAATVAPAPVLTGVTVVGTSHRVDVGAQVRFSGQLTYSGTSTSRPRVVLQERAGSRWRPVAQGRADAGGSITLTAPRLVRTSSFRLVAGRGSKAVRSARWRVAMHPLVTVDVSVSKGQATIDVRALGGFRGDGVTLVTRKDGHLLIVGRARLDASGAASLVVTPDRRRTTYRLVLASTAKHASAQVAVVVRLARGGGG